MNALSSGLHNILLPDNLSIPDELVSLYNKSQTTFTPVLLQWKPGLSPSLKTQLCALKAKCQQIEWLYKTTVFTTIHKDMHKIHILHYKDFASTKSANYWTPIHFNEDIPPPHSQMTPLTY